MATMPEKELLLSELNKFFKLSLQSSILSLGKGTHFWDCMEAAWPYWQAGCRPTVTTNMDHNVAAIAMAVDEMNDAGDHAAYEVRTYALQPTVKFLAALLLHANAAKVEFPWCSSSSTNEVAIRKDERMKTLQQMINLMTTMYG